MINANSGRSMIEMMGVLTIIGALSTGGIVGYTKALRQNKIKTSVEQINVISGHLSTIGANGGLYRGLNNKAAIKFKAVLPEMNPSGDTLINPFGGSVTIASAKLLNGGGDDQAYTIEYGGLDVDACATLASHDWGNAANSSFIGVSAGSSPAADNIYLKCNGVEATTASVTGCNKGSNISIPVPVSKAATACSQCQNHNCSLVLKYY